jgi:hypothetical protein
MLKTKYRQEYTLLNDDIVHIVPTAETQQHYVSLGHPEWGTPDNLVSFTGNPMTTDEWFRGEEDNRRDKWNDCEHYMSTFNPHDITGLYFSWTSPTSVTPSRWWSGLSRTKSLINVVYDYMNPSLSGPVLYVPRDDGGFVPPPPGLATLQQRSLNAMMPGVKAELSLINSIIELKDFRSLPRTITKMVKTAGIVASTAKALTTAIFKSRNKVGRSFSPSLGNTLREVMKTGADGYLQTQFNILPLLSDIQGLQRSLSRVEKVIRNLIERQGRTQRRHYTFRWNPYVAKDPLVEKVWDKGFDTTFHTVGGEVLYYGTSDTIWCTSYIPDSTATFHAEIEYNYHYTQFQLEHAKILGLLDMLGINLNPSIIWNAVPWSFVVDWVFGVNRWLDDRKVLNMEPVINISRYLWSWKYSREIRRRIHGTNIRTGGFGPQVLPSVHQSIYRRTVGLPDKAQILLSGLSPKEISLGVALAITRKRRPYNRGR